MPDDQTATAYEVDPFKITVSYKAARSDGNYGSDEAFASVQQAIPDEATDDQISTAVAFLANVLKAAVQAALPEAPAPKVQHKAPRTQAARADGTVPVKAWSPRSNAYVPAEEVFKSFEEPAWLQAACADQAPDASEIVYAQKKDKTGFYFQARTASGGKVYLNEPDDDEAWEEPF